MKSRLKSEITGEIMKSRVKSWNHWNHVWNQKSRRDLWKIEISYAILVRVVPLGFISGTGSAANVIHVMTDDTSIIQSDQVRERSSLLLDTSDQPQGSLVAKVSDEHWISNSKCSQLNMMIMHESSSGHPELYIHCIWPYQGKSWSQSPPHQQLCRWLP